MTDENKIKFVFEILRNYNFKNSNDLDALISEYFEAFVKVASQIEKVNLP